ncbi:MAG: uroporphyrinogen-III decarboxylase-like protein [Anaerolineae bacterium]|nr:MAG: uroporphyrinogen-III decarboxylase-like protein [Anaerolineae bacterium]
MKIENWPWQPNPDYTRLLKALRRQGDPGYVPFLELFADWEIIAALLDEPLVPSDAQKMDRGALEKGLDQKIRFWHRLGYDAFWQGAILELPQTRLEADDTASLPRDKRHWVDEQAGVITGWADFERYPWPSASDADLYPMEYVARHLPEGMAVIASTGGILEPVMWLMGYQTFALAIYDQPGLIEAMFAKIAEIYVPHARALAQMDRVMALWMGDDMGFKTGTMIAPDHLRQFVFPIQKQIAAVAHEPGMPFLLHSCGNLEAVMDDLIDDVGIDARHSFEDAIEPVESFAACYSDRTAVVGGVDVDILGRGTEEQVRDRKREVLANCAPS